MSSRRKPISAEEEALFRLALQDVLPLKGRPRPAAESRPRRVLPPPAALLRDLALVREPAYNEQPAPGIGGHADAHLRRGRIEPEARLDLHGLHQDAAYRTLLKFLVLAQSQGRKFILVITGKGGVLRSMLPLWLGQAELRGLVGGLSQAHVKHGGSGAFYVAIRKPKRLR
jgi:DNA-nicking Smr family endonuclease